MRSAVRTKTKANLWRSTSEVIEWFNLIDSKSESSFIIFDVVEFYPSITAELMNLALDFASNYTNITNEDRHIIMHAKRSILINNGEAWTKRRTSTFDVTMGSHDGAESCEIIGLYLLNTIKKNLPGNYGLYRDDGLGVVKATPRQIENTKKKLCSMFKSIGLKITVEANQKSVDFLDITLDLKNATYKPYMKPNNNPIYVHRKSNHPQQILKNIPISINKRLSNISSDEEVFNNARAIYQTALKNSGYEHQLHYHSTPRHRPRANRQRRITWFNPPFSKNLATNIGKKFFTILDREIPKYSALHAIFNRNTVKLSYSCMPSIAGIINKQNKQLLNKTIHKNTDLSCNCKDKGKCPLKGECRKSNLIYQATVSTPTTIETYIGLTSTDFKARLYNHQTSFKNSGKRQATELSKYIWKLKDEKAEYTIDWKIITRAAANYNKKNSCNLCNMEKYYIIRKPETASLNQRSGLISACRHLSKYMLSY